jgi:hypothetical protein
VLYPDADMQLADTAVLAASEATCPVTWQLATLQASEPAAEMTDSSFQRWSALLTVVTATRLHWLEACRAASEDAAVALRALVAAEVTESSEAAAQGAFAAIASWLAGPPAVAVVTSGPALAGVDAAVAIAHLLHNPHDTPAPALDVAQHALPAVIAARTAVGPCAGQERLAL